MDQHQDTLDTLLAQPDHFFEGLWFHQRPTWPKGGQSEWGGGKREFLVCFPRPSRRSGGAEGKEGGREGERRGGDGEEEKAELAQAGVSGPHGIRRGHTHTPSLPPPPPPPPVSSQPPALPSEDTDLRDTRLSAPPAEQRTPVSAATPPPLPPAARRRKPPASQVPDFTVWVVRRSQRAAAFSSRPAGGSPAHS